jgi:hypothetical protein
MTTVLLLMMVMAMAQTEAVSEILQAKYRGNNARVEELLKSSVTLNIFEAAATGQTARVRELLAANPSLLNAYAPDGFHPLGPGGVLRQQGHRRSAASGGRRREPAVA